MHDLRHYTDRHDFLVSFLGSQARVPVMRSGIDKLGRYVVVAAEEHPTTRALPPPAVIAIDRCPHGMVAVGFTGKNIAASVRQW